MKYTKQLIFLGLFVFSAGLSIVSCKQEKAPEVKTENPKNPNGDSELAITMREMMEFSKQLKTEIETKNQAIPYPESIKKILTAKETEGMIKDRVAYTGFANHYLATLDSLYQPGADVKKHFNSTVNSCISCHTSYCQGPIPAIQKLYVTEAK